MSLVKLHDTKGNPVWINPQQVLLISGASTAGGVPSIGEAAVALLGATLAIKGSPDEVASELNGYGKSLLT